jgi:8-oxo-dGTP pyrophosphatase MutT (NUDIX family)
MGEPRTKAGVVIILVWRHQFFMILRDDKPEILFPNTWCPVTGGREADETLQQAAERELEEEIGFVPEHLAMLGISAKGNAFLFGRLTDKERSVIVLGEGQGYDFFPYEALGSTPIGGAMKIYLERYPQVFKAMAEVELPPFGRELGLATWNGEHD